MSVQPRTSVEALERLAYDALANGATREGSRYVEWHIAGNCRSPVRVNQYSRASESARALRRIYVPATHRRPGVHYRPSAGVGMEVTLLTRCRRCEACLAARAQHWRYRAVAECQKAPRTWFGTLTLNPGEHYRIDALVRQRETNWHDLSPEGLFALRSAEVGKYLTLWLKRVRKNSGTHFKYLSVTEEHTGKTHYRDKEIREAVLLGYPHIHVLIHEMEGALPLRKKFLTGRMQRNGVEWEYPPAWCRFEDGKRVTLGFTKFKLLEPEQPLKGAMYLCKYLSKSMLARVRASEHYGNVSDITLVE